MRRLRRAVEVQADRLASFRSSVEKVTVNYTPREGGGGGSPMTMEDAILRIMELEEEYRRTVLEYRQAVVEAERLIARLKDPVQRTVLRQRYLENRSWTAIGQEVGYERRKILAIHDVACEMLQKC